MIKIENVVLPSPEQWEAVIRGMRNPKNSWDRSDSYTTRIEDAETLETADYEFFVGENDLDLMERLAKGGSVHGKYRRMIPVYLDITAPLYWWKEFDTYKVGTVCNSCSTMHKIHAKEFTIEDFSCEHLIDSAIDDEFAKEFELDILEKYTLESSVLARGNECGFMAMGYKDSNNKSYVDYYSPKDILELFVISALNANREAYLKTKDKKYWWQMIQLLPSSYNQKRTIFLNYEVLASMYYWRKNHKLDEWRTFCEWIETLPYAHLITGETAK